VEIHDMLGPVCVVHRLGVFCGEPVSRSPGPAVARQASASRNDVLAMKLAVTAQQFSALMASILDVALGPFG
jgi:hypothetical protein